MMRSVHKRMERNENPILMLLGLATFLILFCIVIICEKVKDTYKNLLGRFILWRRSGQSMKILSLVVLV